MELILSEAYLRDIQTKSRIKIDKFDVLYGVSVSPEYYAPLKLENEWIKLDEGVFLQQAK